MTKRETSDRNVNAKDTYRHIYFNSFLTLDNNLDTVQASDVM